MVELVCEGGAGEGTGGMMKGRRVGRCGKEWGVLVGRKSCYAIDN